MLKKYNLLSDENIAKKIKYLGKKIDNENSTKEDLLRALSSHKKLLEDIQEDKKVRDEFTADKEKFETLKEFALKGFATLASGHELCGITNSMWYYANKLPEGNEKRDKLVDLERVNSIFLSFSDLNSSKYKYINSIDLEKSINNFRELNVEIEITNSCKEINFYSSVSVFNAIVYNLVGNAVYFSRKSSDTPKIIIDYKEGELLFLDNGSGVAKEDEHKLFSYGYSNRKNGHGFGLALCKEFGMTTRIDVSYDPNSKFNTLGGACFKLKSIFNK
jgi:signal transduction histidine kinase